VRASYNFQIIGSKSGQKPSIPGVQSPGNDVQNEYMVLQTEGANNMFNKKYSEKQLDESLEDRNQYASPSQDLNPIKGSFENSSISISYQTPHQVAKQEEFKTASPLD
jgi:hypothetical protein